MLCWYVCFFFKQKTAYEMRISDWSSDVCSSDLFPPGKAGDQGDGVGGMLCAHVGTRRHGGQLVVGDAIEPQLVRTVEFLTGQQAGDIARSDVRCVGKEGASACSVRWSHVR